MIERARKAGIPGEIVLADAAYGDSAQFRNGVRRLGFDFAVGIRSTVRVVRLDSRDRINEKSETGADLVQRLGRKHSENSPGAKAPAASSARTSASFESRPPMTTASTSASASRSGSSPSGSTEKKTHQIPAHHACSQNEPQADRTDLQGALAHPADVRRPQGRARSRSFRRKVLPGLASSRLSRLVLLRFRHRGTHPRFPPRPPGSVALVRSPGRPERHFADSFITIRLAIALLLAHSLPRCPDCPQPHDPSRCSIARFTQLS